MTNGPHLYRGDEFHGNPTSQQLAEEHHRYYGRPWILGRCIFDTVIGFGIAQDAKVLDFGCGAGRLAIWLIRYLDAGNYYGIEAHRESVDALIRYEIPLHGLGNKCATISHDSGLDLGVFGVTFDVVVDAYSSAHLNQSQMAEFRGNLGKCMQPGGLYVTCPEPAILDALPLAGFELARQYVSECGWLTDSGKSTATIWHVYQKIA